MIQVLTDADPAFDKWNFGSKSFGFSGTKFEKESFLQKEVDQEGQKPTQPENIIKVPMSKEKALNSEVPLHPTSEDFRSQSPAAPTPLLLDENQNQFHNHIKPSFISAPPPPFNRPKKFKSLEGFLKSEFSQTSFPSSTVFPATTSSVTSNTFISTTAPSLSPAQAAIANTNEGILEKVASSSFEGLTKSTLVVPSVSVKMTSANPTMVSLNTSSAFSTLTPKTASTVAGTGQTTTESSKQISRSPD